MPAQSGKAGIICAEKLRVEAEPDRLRSVETGGQATGDRWQEPKPASGHDPPGRRLSPAAAPDNAARADGAIGRALTTAAKFAIL